MTIDGRYTHVVSPPIECHAYPIVSSSCPGMLKAGCMHTCCPTLNCPAHFVPTSRTIPETSCPNIIGFVAMSFGTLLCPVPKDSAL